MKVKARLDTLTDGVIAIIMTIMVLELPTNLASGHVNLSSLFYAIAIYADSFAFVANIWFQQTTLFTKVEKISNKIIKLQISLLFFLSLIPAMTNVMVADESNLPVMIYGALYLIVTLMFAYISHEVVNQQYTDKTDMRKVFQAIYGSDIIIDIPLAIAGIIVGYFYPKIAMILFLIIPIRAFLCSDKAQNELADVESMDETGRSEYLNLTRAQRREFSQSMREYYHQVSDNNLTPDQQKQYFGQFITKVSQQAGVPEDVMRNKFKSLANVFEHRGPHGKHPSRREVTILRRTMQDDSDDSKSWGRKNTRQN